MMSPMQVRSGFIGRRAVLFFLAFIFGAFVGAVAAPAEDVFHPGEIWRDNAGAPINAHGGGILYFQGIYYWYGELKQGETYLPKSNTSWGGTRVLAGGVSCYASTDLYHWTNEGVVLPSLPDRPDEDLYDGNVIERPKVIYNSRTKQFVMWLHQDDGRYAAARSGVALSQSPTATFHYLGSFRPDAGRWPVNVTPADKTPAFDHILQRDFSGGQMARDQTVFVDDDGAAYLFYASENNATMHVSRLTDDYLHTTGQYARILDGQSIEAPAVFKARGKYFLIGSGCTGWAPNAAHCAVAEHIFGPWTELGNPCRGENAAKTFNCQVTYVLPLPGRQDCFIALFDRWQQWDLANSRYVWLPLTFENAKPVIKWQGLWSITRLTAGLPLPSLENGPSAGASASAELRP